MIYRYNLSNVILIVPEEGWFDQPKCNTPDSRSWYVVLVLAFILLIFTVC